RSMEEEVEVVLSQGDGFLSEEDDHWAPTDASEDSVEVRVTPVAKPTNIVRSIIGGLNSPPSTPKLCSSSRGPDVTSTIYHKPTVRRPLRPNSSPTHHKLYCPSSPLQQASCIPSSPRNTKTYTPSSRNQHNLFKYQKHYQLGQDLLVQPTRPYTPERDSPGSPRLGPRSPSSPHLQYPSPTTSPLEPLTGAAPLSPGRAHAPRNRRKPAEPRRVLPPPGSVTTGHKRAHSPDTPPQTIKVKRLLQTHADKERVAPPLPPSPPVPGPLLHHPLLGPLTRTPSTGPFPLLLPPQWPPVPSQWVYPGIVAGPGLGWPGLPPHPSYTGLGLMPPNYGATLAARMPPQIHHPSSAPVSATARSSPPPKFTPPPSPVEELLCHRRHGPTSATLAQMRMMGHRVDSSPNDNGSSIQTDLASPAVRKSGGKPPSKFLSVESLLASDGPDLGPRYSEEHATLQSEVSEDVLQNHSGGDPVKVSSSQLSISSRSPGYFHDPDEEDDDSSIQSLLAAGKQKQRNYKNMTRERRIEANARERTRVHTISAAFETLRNAVPSYSHNQKLSKLSVLRIACSYILSLSRLAGHDYSEGGSAPSFSDCVDLTTRTIQVEGKPKKKRDDP
ncbi:unnamed protein product, partial [Meganyctiphanes norvegica]